MPDILLQYAGGHETAQDIGERVLADVEPIGHPSLRERDGPDVVRGESSLGTDVQDHPLGELNSRLATPPS